MDLNEEETEIFPDPDPEEDLKNKDDKVPVTISVAA
jgi:hypothetical protein